MAQFPPLVRETGRAAPVLSWAVIFIQLIQHSGYFYSNMIASYIVYTTAHDNIRPYTAIV
jgi:hypothetical protein